MCPDVILVDLRRIADAWLEACQHAITDSFVDGVVEALGLAQSTHAYKTGLDMVVELFPAVFAKFPVAVAAAQASWAFLGPELNAYLNQDEAGNADRIGRWRDAARGNLDSVRQGPMAALLREVADAEWDAAAGSVPLTSLDEHQRRYRQFSVTQRIVSRLFGADYTLPRMSVSGPIAASSARTPAPPEVGIERASVRREMKRCFDLAIEVRLCSGSHHVRLQARAVAALSMAAFKAGQSLSYVHYINQTGIAISVPSSGPQCDSRTARFGSRSNTLLRQDDPERLRYWVVQASFSDGRTAPLVRWTRSQSGQLWFRLEVGAPLHSSVSHGIWLALIQATRRRTGDNAPAR